MSKRDQFVEIAKIEEKDEEIQETVNEDSIEVLVEEGSVENVVSDENNMSE